MDVELTESFLRPLEAKSDQSGAIQDLDTDLALDHGSSEARQNKQKQVIPVSPRLRRQIGWIVNSIWMKLFVFLLIVCDALILISETIVDEEFLDDRAVSASTDAILGFLLLELLLRIVYLDVAFFKDVWCVMDLCVTLGSLILSLEFDDFGRFVLLMRFARLGRICFITLRQQSQMKQAARQKVSQNRRRYKKDGFDLDITYITSRIIAMSVPSVKFESFYRNPVQEVARFFNSKHKDNYRIYNLCPERSYPYALFQNRVVEYFMGDHNPAPLETILAFCQDAVQYLRGQSQHIIAVHCKGGKGRTGTMICSLCLYMGLFKTASQALDFFANRRTAEFGEREGVEAPSQERYVRYFESIVNQFNSQLPPPVVLSLKFIRVHCVSAVTKEWRLMWFVLTRGIDSLLYDHSEEQDRVEAVKFNETQGYADYVPSSEIRLVNDIKVGFFVQRVKNYSTLRKRSLQDYLAVPASPSGATPHQQQFAFSAPATQQHQHQHSSDKQKKMKHSPQAKSYGKNAQNSHVPPSPDSSATTADAATKQDSEATASTTIGRLANMQQQERQEQTDEEQPNDTEPSSSDNNATSSAMAIKLRVNVQAEPQNSSADSEDAKQKPIITPRSAKAMKKGAPKPLFGFWFHTSFVDPRRARFTREHVDGVRKGREPDRFAPEFAVEVFFRESL